MGKVIEKIKLTNDLDLEMSRLGYISPDEVRRCEVDALIDTGSTLLALPKEVVEELGLRIVRRANVRYALK